MLALRVRMEFAPQNRDEAAAVLRSLVGPVRAERGCRATDVLTSAASNGTYTWIEEWQSVEDFESHLRGASFRRILALIDMASGPPVVEIDDVASRRGFELVEEILGASPVEAAEGGTS